MNKNLKIALKNRSSEQGFAIPIAVGMGLIMLLIATTMIVRSQGDQVTASAQKGAADSLSTSETGVTRVQSLFNTWRVLPSVTLTNIDTSSSSWQKVFDASPVNVCLASGASNPTAGYRVNEWITLTNGDKFKIIDYTYKPDPYKFVDGTSGPRDYTQIGVTGSNFIIPASNAGTVVVTPANYLASGNSASGHIQGIQGTLTNNAGTYNFKRRYSAVADTTISGVETFYPDKVPGVGTLKLEGQIGTNTTATNALQVSIPVNEVPLSSVPFPGLWIRGGTIPANNTIQGNLVVSSCNANVGGTILAPGQRVANPYISLPDLPTKIRAPRTTLSSNAAASTTILRVSLATGFQVGDKLKVGNDSAVYTIQSIDTTSSPNRITIDSTGLVTAQGINRVVRLINDLGNIQGGGSCREYEGDTCIGTLTLPRTSIDTADPDGIYRYSVTSIDIDGSNKVIITPGNKVTFYLNGDMHIQSEIRHNCAAGACNATNFQIYGYGNTHDSHTIGGVQVSHICINGSGATYGFILAPEYTIGVAGSGGSAGFIGSVWTKQWNPHPGGISSCGSNTTNTVVTQTADWDALGPELAPKNIPPKLGSISSWQRQEASP